MGPWFWALDALGRARRGSPSASGSGTLASLAAARRPLAAAPARAEPRRGAGRHARVPLTPYQLAFTARSSVLLLPWAALPWLLGLTDRAPARRRLARPGVDRARRAADRRRQRVVAVLVGIGPVVWLLLGRLTGREPAAPGRRGRRAGWRCSAVGVSLWWIAALRLEAAYGLPVLQVTENLESVAATSLARATCSAASATGSSTGATGSASRSTRPRTTSRRRSCRAHLRRPRARPGGRAAAPLAAPRLFVLLVLVGTVVAVGAWPLDDPSPFASAWPLHRHVGRAGPAEHAARGAHSSSWAWPGCWRPAVGSRPRVPWRRVGGGAVAVLAAGRAAPGVDRRLPVRGVDRPVGSRPTGEAAAADLDARRPRRRGCWSCPARTSPPTAGATPSTRSSRASWTGPTWPARCCRRARPSVAAGRARPPAPGGHARARRSRRSPASSARATSRCAPTSSIERGRSRRRTRARVGRPHSAPRGCSTRGTYGPPGGTARTPTCRRWRCSTSRTPSPSCAPRPPSPRRSWPATATASSTRPRPAWSTAARSCSQATALDDAELDGALEEGADLVVTDTYRRRIQTWFYAIRDTRGPTERAGETPPEPTGYDYRIDPSPGIGDDRRTVVEQVGGTVEATGGGGGSARGPRRPRRRRRPATAWRVGGADPAGRRSRWPLTARS